MYLCMICFHSAKDGPPRFGQLFVPYNNIYLETKYYNLKSDDMVFLPYNGKSLYPIFGCRTSNYLPVTIFTYV